MNRLTNYSLITLFLASLFTTELHGQYTLRIIVNNGSATTTCTDPFSGPDPAWGINVDGQGWVNFVGNATCDLALPAPLYEQSFQCIADVPSTVQVCLRAFEDDAFFLDPCTEVITCQVEECFDVPVVYFGSEDRVLELSDGLASDGEVNITVAAQGMPGGLFDDICQAFDLGVLQKGETYGDATQSLFNNYCATAINEPTPYDFGAGWSNEQSVWAKFTTGDDPSSIIHLLATSDPSNLGDPINLQMAIFSSDDNTCTGNFDLVEQNFTYQIYDEWIYFECAEPNTTYFVLIDAVSGSFSQLQGYFGFEIRETGLEDAPNQICDALVLGTIPEGDSINVGPMTNVCADAVGDVPNGSFFIDQGVWFTFTPPPSGHVLIEAVSDVDDVPINIQMALYSSTDGTCNGSVAPIAIGNNLSNFDETMEVSCLNPGQTYFLLVDGHAANDGGIFTLNISDAGEDTPITMLDESVCFNGTFTVGNTTYSQTGSYIDTLYLPNGCDSIVMLDLAVLTPLELNFSIVTQGVFAGNTDGEAQVAPTGSSGNYTYQWDNGQTTALATGLVGGENYCVVVTDEIGCTLDTCFEMPYYTHFVPQVTGSQVDCFGDTDGTIEFTVAYGVPPYIFSWQNAGNTLSGSGTITEDGQVVILQNLPSDLYEFYFEDAIFDTTIVVAVDEPDLLEVNNAQIANASCFGECDGLITLDIIGGNPPYQVVWSNAQTGITASGLCKGNFLVAITDAKGCTANYEYEIDEPIEFIATGIEVQPVSCFEGSDGIASVITNGSPIAFQWDFNSETTESISGLTGGEYAVTVTNSDGCTDETSALIGTPDTPVEVMIQLEKAIVCNGGSDGALRAIVTGPGNDFTFSWSNGANTPNVSELPIGNYEVVVENELGCQATATFFLDQPTVIETSFTTNQLTCNDPPNGGIAFIETTTGGVPPYAYSSDGSIFSDTESVAGFIAGTQTLYVKDAGGCVQEFEITIPGPEEMIVSLGNDLQIDLGDEVELEVQVNISDVTYEWLPAIDSLCSGCSSIEFQPIETGIYSVIVTDQFDCTEVADVFIEVLKKRKVFVPNAFSPNGDGINDHFMPFTGDDVSTIYSFQVFDRQGNHVFSTKNFTPGDITKAWDGHFRGQAMRTGVFVWFAEIGFIDGAKEVFKGEVNLIR